MALKDRTLNFNLSQQLDRSLLKSGDSTARLTSATFVQGDKTPVNLRFLEISENSLQDVYLEDEIIEVCARWNLTNEELFTPSQVQVEAYGVGIDGDGALVGGFNFEDDPQGANFTLDSVYPITQDGIDLKATVKATSVNAQGQLVKGIILSKGAGYDVTKPISIENPLGSPMPSNNQTLTSSINAQGDYTDIDFNKNALLELDINIPESPSGVVFQTGYGQTENTINKDLKIDYGYDSYLSYPNPQVNTNNQIIGWTVTNIIDFTNYLIGSASGIKMSRDSSGSNNTAMSTDLQNVLNPGSYDFCFDAIEYNEMNYMGDSSLDIELSTDGGSTYTTIHTISLDYSLSSDEARKIAVNIPVTMDSVDNIRLSYNESSSPDATDYFAFSNLNIVRRKANIGWSEDVPVSSNCEFKEFNYQVKRTNTQGVLSHKKALDVGTYYVQFKAKELKQNTPSESSTLFLDISKSPDDNDKYIDFAYESVASQKGRYLGIAKDRNTTNTNLNGVVEHQGSGWYEFTSKFVVTQKYELDASFDYTSYTANSGSAYVFPTNERPVVIATQNTSSGLIEGQYYEIIKINPSTGNAEIGEIGGVIVGYNTSGWSVVSDERKINFEIDKQHNLFGIKDFYILDENKLLIEEVDIDAFIQEVSYTVINYPAGFIRNTGQPAPTLATQNIFSGNTKALIAATPHEEGSGSEFNAVPDGNKYRQYKYYRVDFTVNAGSTGDIQFYSDSGNFTWPDATTSATFTPTISTGSNTIFFSCNQNNNKLGIELTSVMQLSYFKITDATNALATDAIYATQASSLTYLSYNNTQGLQVIADDGQSSYLPETQKIATIVNLKGGESAQLRMQNSGSYIQSSSGYTGYGVYSQAQNVYYAVLGYNEINGWSALGTINKSHYSSYSTGDFTGHAMVMRPEEDISLVAVRLTKEPVRIDTAVVVKDGSSINSQFLNGNFVTEVGQTGANNATNRGRVSIDVSSTPLLSGDVKISYFIDYNNHLFEVYADGVLLGSSTIADGFNGNRRPWSDSEGVFGEIYTDAPVVTSQFSGTYNSSLNYYKGVQNLNLANDDIRDLEISTDTDTIRYNAIVNLDGIKVHEFFDLGFDRGEATFDVQARNSSNTRVRTIARFKALIHKDVNFNGSSGTPFIP